MTIILFKELIIVIYLMVDYQFEELFENRISKKNLYEWKPSFGPRVISRNEDGTSKSVEFNIIHKNSNMDLFIVGDFNNWGSSKEVLKDFKLLINEFGTRASIILTDLIKHGDEYKFLIINKKTGKEFHIQDPAGVYFADNSNTIFWDFEDPSTYKMKYNFINNFDRSIKILQSDLPGLIVHFKDSKTGKLGSDFPQKDYYRFITDSGIIKKIKELGFNTIQFLPFAQSIDGDNWKYRYLVPFQYAIQKNWGNPDDFARMIDEFHKHDIAVIGDFVLGHIPDRNFKIFGSSSDFHGIHHFTNFDGSKTYFKDETSWGSGRINFDDVDVREFFQESVIHFLKNYKIDGVRVDNVDGIIRYGDNGDGEERKNGRRFLRELNRKIYDYNPSAMINFESHYYVDDNSKMLVAPLNSDIRALGATAYNSSRETFYFHTQYMLKMATEISVWKFKEIAEEKEWGKSNSCIADFHNHDAAAGLMEGRATGSYAYDAMTHNNESNHIHAIGKIKVMEAIISFTNEGRTLDLIQTFLLQTGTFEHDSSIKWFLEFNPISRNMINFKRRINEIMEDEAFWPINTKNRKYLNLDEKNKIIIIERKSKELNSNYLILINLSDFKTYNYKIGLDNKNDYELIFNSDEIEYAGFGFNSYQNIYKNKKSNNFGLLDREIEIEQINPYQILVFKKIKNN